MRYLKHIFPLFVTVSLVLCGLLAPSNGIDDAVNTAPADRLNRVLILFTLLVSIISIIKIIEFFLKNQQYEHNGNNN